MFLYWRGEILNATVDIARLIVYEADKHMEEALGEVHYTFGFAWWFTSEARHIRGSVAIPSVSGRRTIIIK